MRRVDSTVTDVLCSCQNSKLHRRRRSSPVTAISHAKEEAHTFLPHYNSPSVQLSAPCIGKERTHPLSPELSTPLPLGLNPSICRAVESSCCTLSCMEMGVQASLLFLAALRGLFPSILHSEHRLGCFRRLPQCWMSPRCFLRVRVPVVHGVVFLGHVRHPWGV